MRLLVLGKSGQIGTELQRSLAPLGELIAMGRTEANLEAAGQLRQAVLDATPDVIVNAAAYTAVDKAEGETERADRINHLAVGELAAIAADRRAWLIHYSTDYVFDGAKPSPYNEADTTNPLSVYGRSKLAGERAALSSGVDTLIFRTSWVHGEHGHNFIRTVLKLGAERDSLNVVADQFGAPTAAALIADATANAVRAITAGAAPNPGIYHLAAAGEVSWHGLARFVIETATAHGASLRLRAEDVTAIPTTAYPTPARRPANSMLDTSKLRSALNLDLPDWRDGVRQTVVALLAQGHAK